MAKQNLPVNYKDDVMSSAMGAKRRWQITQNTDGTYNIEDVTTYDQVGSEFGAGDINATNQAVNESFDKNKLIRDMDAINALTQEGYAPDALALKDVNDSLGGLSFGYDSTSGKYGYWKKEADTEVFVPFRGIFSMPEECFVYTTKGVYGDGYVIMESNYLKICGHSNSVACFGIKIPANTTIGIEWGFDKYSDKATVKFGLQDWSNFTQNDAITQSLYNQMVSSDVNKKTDTYSIPNNTSGFWVLKIICDHTNNNANSPYIKLYGIS